MEAAEKVFEVAHAAHASVVAEVMTKIDDIQTTVDNYQKASFTRFCAPLMYTLSVVSIYIRISIDEIDGVEAIRTAERGYPTE